MYTNGELKTKIATLAQRANDVEYATKIQDFINYAQDYAFRKYDFYAELEDEYQFSTVSGTENYFMPASFAMPLRIYDLTNTRKLIWQTQESYVDSNISSIANSDTGIPYKARLYGISAVNAAISSSGITFKAKSSSIQDTTGCTIRIEGYIDSGKTIIDYEDIVISSGGPTTYVANASPKTFYKVTHISKSTDTYGYITIADSAGNIMAIIASTDRASRYPVLKLGLIPNSTNSMLILFKRRVKKLTDDNDYPFIDADEFFINYGLAYCLNEEKETVERAAQIWAKAEDTLNAVIRNQQTRLGEDFQHKMVVKHAQAHRV